MDVGTILTTTVALAGIAGGFIGGRKSANTNAMGIAVSTVDLLQVQVATLVQQNVEKDTSISVLEGKVDVLESLVTQRADVEAVHEDVRGVRGVVDRIAHEMGVE